MTNDEVEKFISIVEKDMGITAATIVRRLRDERDQARAALEPFAPPNTYDFYSDHDFADDAGIMMFWNTAKEAKDFCDWMTNYIEQYRTAARLHAETGEKE